MKVHIILLHYQSFIAASSKRVAGYCFAHQKGISDQLALINQKVFHTPIILLVLPYFQNVLIT